MKRQLFIPPVLFAVAFSGCASVSAQIAQGGVYPLEQSVIASGGGAVNGSTASAYSISGTIGHFDRRNKILQLSNYSDRRFLDGAEPCADGGNRL